MYEGPGNVMIGRNFLQQRGSQTSGKGVGHMEHLAALRGVSEPITTDNGSEFACSDGRMGASSRC
jgi:hypothetical protein